MSLARTVDVPYSLGVEYEADIVNPSLVVENQECASNAHRCDACYPTDACAKIAAIVRSPIVLTRGRKDREDRLTQTTTQ